jgi:hypothetical protein
MPSKLDSKRLKARLLEAGLAPRYVKRVTGELADHLSDIEAELKADGLSSNAAAAEAERRLGTIDDLARRILDQRPKESLVARHPGLSFSAGTLAAAFLLGGGTLATAILLADGVKALGVREGLLIMIFGGWHYLFLSYLMCPLMAAYACWTAYSHRVSLRWPLVATILMAIVGGILLQVDLTIAATAGPGPHGHYSIGFGLFGHEPVRSVWRLISPLAVFAGFALWARTKGREVMGYRMEL